MSYTIHMTQTAATASHIYTDAEFIMTMVIDEGLCERIVKRARVTDAEVSATRALWRAEMRANPERSSGRIHVREA